MNLPHPGEGAPELTNNEVARGEVIGVSVAVAPSGQRCPVCSSRGELVRERDKAARKPDYLCRVTLIEMMAGTLVSCVEGIAPSKDLLKTFHRSY